jgi:hypothetical protein
VITNPDQYHPATTEYHPATTETRTHSQGWNTALYQFDAKIDGKALRRRIGHADVAFTMKQDVQTDLEADRQVANTRAALIIGGALASTVISDEEREDQGATADGDPGEAA